MTSRAPERTRFLDNVLTTFLEGGIDPVGYVKESELIKPEPHDATTWYYEWADVVYRDEPDKVYRVTRETVAHGLSEIGNFSKEVPWASESWRRRVTAISRVNGEHGDDIDAADASNVVEVALFGEVVYG